MRYLILTLSFLTTSHLLARDCENCMPLPKIMKSTTKEVMPLPDFIDSKNEDCTNCQLPTKNYDNDDLFDCKLLQKTYDERVKIGLEEMVSSIKDGANFSDISKSCKDNELLFQQAVKCKIIKTCASKEIEGTIISKDSPETEYTITRYQDCSFHTQLRPKTENIGFFMTMKKCMPEKIKVIIQNAVNCKKDKSHRNIFIGAQTFGVSAWYDDYNNNSRPTVLEHIYNKQSRIRLVEKNGIIYVQRFNGDSIGINKKGKLISSNIINDSNDLCGNAKIVNFKGKINLVPTYTLRNSSNFLGVVKQMVGSKTEEKKLEQLVKLQKTE